MEARLMFSLLEVMEGTRVRWIEPALMAKSMSGISIIHSTTTLSLVSPSLLLVWAVPLQVSLLAANMTSHIGNVGLLVFDSRIGNTTHFVQVDVSTPPSLSHLF